MNDLRNSHTIVPGEITALRSAEMSTVITHIAFFKLKDGVERTSPSVAEAEKFAREVGRNVPELLTWRVGWNQVDRDIAYDFAVIGVLRDLAALQKYQTNDFHKKAVEKWRSISDWVVVDLAED